MLSPSSSVDVNYPQGILLQTSKQASGEMGFGSPSIQGFVVVVVILVTHPQSKTPVVSLSFRTAIFHSLISLRQKPKLDKNIAFVDESNA